MNKIDDLIKQYCPNGVEYDIIKNICNISRGRVMSKEYLRDNIGEYPVYSSQTVNEGILGKIDTYDYDGEYLTWTTDGANAGSIFYRTGKFSITNVCGLLKITNNKVNTKFLHYYLGTVAKNYVNVGMGNPKLMSNVMATIKVAIPPLPVQEEIVRVLDTFTALEAELEAELEARKKQYEYYRNKLLTFNENTTGGDRIKFMQLGEVCNKVSTIKWKNNQDKEYKYIDLSSLNRNNNTIEDAMVITNDNAPSRAQQIVKKDDVLFGTTRPTLRRYCIIPNEYDNQICSTGYCVLRADTNTIIPQYLFFMLTTNSFYNYVEEKQSGASYPSISDTLIKKYIIPVPPLEEQERIVAILDKFDSLVNDISEGLPAELTARRQQYEYYRNKLLTFDEAA